jgi:hypothetical protein
MELYSNSAPDVATKIYTAGLPLFIAEPAFVQSYLDFLTSLNDHSNLKVCIQSSAQDCTLHSNHPNPLLYIDCL